LLSGHQDLGPSVTFGLDLTYNHRTQSTRNAITATSGYLNTPTDVSLAVAPSVKIRMGSDWTASVIGLYGYDHTRYNQLSYSASTATRAAGCYCDRARSAEASAEGPLFHLGGGDARLAFGGGYRWNGFLQRSATSAAAPIQGSQDSYFGFGELFLPLVSPDQAITAVHRLSLDAAVRYERYPGMAQVATPKLGLVYAPTGDFELKGSWGKSFKAPTLLQLYQGVSANLYPASAIGGARFPAGSTALLEGGGNSNLKPERADTWSVSLVAHPQSLPGARLEVSYFHIDYHNRIVQPFAGSAIFNALSDPMYSDYVTYDPTPAQQAAAISAVGQGLTNNSGAPYNPAKVVALVDDVYLNAVQQRIQGVDVAADYRFSIGTSGSVQLRAMGSWLDSRQTISSTAPSLDLSGTIFNPPHVRGRFVASWSDHGVTLTSVVNYVGGLTDPLLTPSAHVGSQTTLDLTAIVDLGASTGLFRNMSLTLTVRNALNQHPPYAAPSGGLAYYVPFDSTNYSAIGRFVGLTVSKTW
jgi:outer membrane receptor protein involved in Fe transport